MKEKKPPKIEYYEDIDPETGSLKTYARMHIKDYLKSRPAAEQGLRFGYKRHSIIIKKKKLERIKDLAYHADITLTKLFDEMVDLYIEAYEDHNGPVSPRP